MFALLLRLGWTSAILCIAAGISLHNTISVVAGNNYIEITCDLGQMLEAPFWTINSTVYELLDIPQYFPSITVNKFESLTLINATENFNNTLFKCATFARNGSIWRINIYSNLDEDITTTLTPLNNLIFDYRKLDIQLNETTVGWTYESICNEKFGLEGFILNFSVPQNLIDDVFIIYEATNATIPSSNLTSGEQPVLYRLVAFGEDGHVCSNKESQTAFYRFDASEYRETEVLAPNSTSCYDIPETDICNISIIFVLQSQGMERAAFCPIHNSSFGQFAFESCIDTAGIDIAEPYFSNGAVCLCDKNSNIDGTFLHFLCSTAPCSDECFVRTILSSYAIVIARPPSEPDVSYNRNSLCFSTFTHEEFPVERFSVAVTDVTGVSTDITGRYNSSSTRFCLSITSYPLPSVCSPLYVIASASNKIGTSPVAQVAFSDHQGDSCNCYQLREQVYFNVSDLLAESALIDFTCQNMEKTAVMDYFLEDLRENRSVSFQCGERKNLTDLTPNTDYTLVRKYTGGIQCNVITFSTGASQRTRETVSIIDVSVISIGVALGSSAFVATIIFCLGVTVRRRRTGRGTIQSKSKVFNHSHFFVQ